MRKMIALQFDEGLNNVLNQIQKKQPQDSIIIAIAGGSCSGKSYFCECLEEKLEILNIPKTKFTLDDYFKDITDPCIPCGNNGKPMFDSPGSYREDEIAEHLTATIAGKTINCPVYCIEKNLRTIGETIRVNPEKVIIVDGLFAIRVVEKIDAPKMCIFVEASTEIRLQRRIKRDEKRFNVDPRITTDTFWSEVEPAYLKYVQPQKSSSDLIIVNEKER